jgi:hypothetical protein
MKNLKSLTPLTKEEMKATKGGYDCYSQCYNSGMATCVNPSDDQNWCSLYLSNYCFDFCTGGV